MEVFNGVYLAGDNPKLVRRKEGIFMHLPECGVLVKMDTVEFAKLEQEVIRVSRGIQYKFKAA